MVIFIFIIEYYQEYILLVLSIILFTLISVFYK